MIEVNDDGEGFDPADDGDVGDLENLTEGGLGIAIIRAIADEFDARPAAREGRGSRLRFAKAPDRVAAPLCCSSSTSDTSRSPTTRSLATRGLMDEIRALAEPLAGKRVLHLSATAFGGGVAEINYTLVPLMQDAGLEVEWRIIRGADDFFNVTKTIHNALQGNPQGLSESAAARSSAATRS